MKNRIIFAFCSPSGAGKSTFINYLLSNYENLFQRYPTVTSRPIRENETQGNPYYFISQNEAEELIKNGEYLEYERKPYNGNIYGKTKSILKDLKEDKFILAEEQMYKVAAFKMSLKDYSIFSIYLLLEDLSVMRDRLIKRGDHVDHIDQRIKYSLNEEKEEKDSADFQIHSYEGNLEKTAGEFMEILKILKYLE